MGTASTIPGLAGGMATGQKNAGLPVAGNNMGLNQFSPIASGMRPPVNGRATPTGLPGATSGITGTPPPGSSAIPFAGTGGLTTATPMGAAPTGATPAGNPATPNADGNPNATLTKNQNKQLTDIYGKGTGSLLSGLIGNLGSNDSSYMQAYNTAMAGQTAKGLSTIGTSLGNAGISANSSTSAIEKASFLSQTEAAAGMQEQGLLQTQMQQEIGLVQGIQGASAQQTATSWLDTAGQVADVAGSFISDAMLMPKGGGQRPSSFPGMSTQPQQLPNVYGGGAPSMPSGISGTGGSGLSGLDF